MTGPAARLEPADPDYPELLREIFDPPENLYVMGRLGAAAGGIAIVGSRRPTPYGRKIARRLAADCAARGIAVVSGLAYGIDAEAHRAVLEAGGIAWAVLGSGFERMYPPEHESLAERIVRSGGAVISELPPKEPPRRGHFPRRNRIVSGLSWGVVVVEGAAGSGSLITAKSAAEQGREVFAVPGPVDSAMSEGPLNLIRNGATPIRSLEEALEELPNLCRAPRSCYKEQSPDEALRCAAAPRVEDQGAVLSVIGSHPASIDELLEVTGLSVSRLAGILNGLEESGAIRALPGQRYARN